MELTLARMACPDSINQRLLLPPDMRHRAAQALSG
jgi:hypothetical protein